MTPKITRKNDAFAATKQVFVRHGGVLRASAAIGFGIIMVGAIWFKAGVKREPFSDIKAHKFGWEYNFLILATTVALFFSGAGRLSIDHYLFGI